MSGRKDYPITITNSQWEEMRRSVTTAESKANNAVQNAIRAETDAKRKIEELQERSRREIDGLNQALQVQARNHNEILNRVENDFNNKLQQQGLSFTEALRRQRIELDRELSNFHENLQSQIDSVNRTLESERQSQSQIASYWINQAQFILNDIDSKKFRHRLFIPRAWDELNSRLLFAQNDINNNSNQAALTTARDVCIKAFELRERVIAKEWEWTQLFNHASINLVGVKNRIERLCSLEYLVSEDGRQISIPAKVNFWTHGALNEAINEQARLENTIRNDIENLLSDDIRSIIEQIDTLDKRISDIDTSAMDNCRASFFRRDFGADLVNKLPGWNIDEVFFESEDDRKDLHIILVHINGRDKLSLIMRGGTQEFDVRTDYNCESIDGAGHFEYVQQVNQAISEIAGCEVKPRTDLRYQGQTRGDISVFDAERIRNQQ